MLLRIAKRRRSAYLRWMDARTQQIVRTCRETSVDFLRVELDIAITLCQSVLLSRDPSHATRQADCAKRALEVVPRFTTRIRLSATERQEMAEKTSQLEALFEKINDRDKLSSSS